MIIDFKLIELKKDSCNNTDPETNLKEVAHRLHPEKDDKRE
jgi:hypothetical protein